VMYNLISNAIKFTSEGSVSVSVDVAEATPDSLRFSVSDTGIGIDPGEQARLFSPFSQADPSTTRRFGGTGLGLAIARMLANGMGGRIELSSELDKGSTFLLFLPLEAVAAAVPATAAADTIELARNEFSGARVLVVEDDATNRIVIEQLLSHAGIEVSLAGNGRQALQTIAAAEIAPDLIIMDLQMPEMDGLTATRILRSEGNRIPVAALTASVSQSDRDACAAAGMSDFLAKPIEIDELAAVLTRWLPAHGATKPAQASASVDGLCDDDDFPGIQIDEALPRFLGRRDVLAQARDAFLEQYRRAPRQLRELASAESWAKMDYIAHSLKGAAASLGARELQTQAKTLEACLKAMDRSGIDGLVRSIELSLEKMSSVPSGGHFK
jgi:two-component system sensor histidine kinase/response regulator